MDARDDFLCMSSLVGTHTRTRPFLTIQYNIPDKTADLDIWSTVELGVGITAACAATLRPLLQALKARFGLSTSSYLHDGTNVVLNSRSNRREPASNYKQNLIFPTPPETPITNAFSSRRSVWRN